MTDRPSVSRTIDDHGIILRCAFWCALSTIMIPIILLIGIMIRVIGGI